MVFRKRSFYFFSAIILFVFTSWISYTAQAEIIWLEAECFENTGGWVNDAQFVDLMGSPYLLANGVDQPVEDAVTQVRIPGRGEYQLWVRCKDWLPSYSPGGFEVTVAGTKSREIFGKSEDDRWKWVHGGRFELDAGNAEIRLHDLTGWWGRCDALVLTDDPDFAPADDLYLLEVQRTRYFQPYEQVEEIKPYDVVVVGGGLAGSAAAIAAARHGCSVVLIQDRPVLGGNASSEIDVPPAGDEGQEPLDPGETGIIEEFYNRPDRGWEHDWSGAIEKVVRGESNIDLRLNTRAINVVMKDNETIEAVLALDVRSGERLLFPGTVFIDCTGDGWIGFWAGAMFRKGREGRSEFNESLAVDAADTKTMGNTLFVAKFREGDDTPFVCPEWAYAQWITEEDFENAGTHSSLEEVLYPVDTPSEPLAHRFTHGSGVHGRQYAYHRPEGRAEKQELRRMPVTPDHYDNFEKGKGYKVRDEHGGFFKWYVELGGAMDTIEDAEKIRDELFRINLGLWNYVKNHHAEYKQKNENRRLTWINFVPGKRESRRLIGDYILTQWDYADRILHEDCVAYGGWGIDIHHPNGYWKSGPMYYNAYRGYKNSIPFRCLYSQNISNLMMAGRDISVSHVALGGTRVMRTNCIMGQAVGTAASLCVENDVPPRTVGKEHIEELQQMLLKDGCYIPGEKNEDPKDLALSAKITASSVKTIEDPASVLSRSGTPRIHDLNTPRAVMFKPGAKRIKQVALYLRSSNSSPTEITATLRPAESFGDFSSRKNLATATASVPPKSKGWVNFELNCDVEPGEYYYVFLPPADGLQWDLFRTSRKETEDTCRAYGGPNWTRRNECYAFALNEEDVDLEDAPQVTLRAENIIDGFNRAVDGVPHSWGPGPSGSLPHWVELTFRKKQKLDTIHVTFQNLAYLCSDYRINVFDGRNWDTVVTVQDNKERRKVHRIPEVTTDRLRLVLNAPASGDEADTPQICEIRIYNESE